MSDKMIIRVRGADSVDTAEITPFLRAELSALEVDSIEAEPGTTLPGAKGDAAQVGELVVTIAGSGIVPAIVQLIRNWVARRGGTGVTLVMGERSLDISDLDQKTQQAAVDAFLRALGQ